MLPATMSEKYELFNSRGIAASFAGVVSLEGSHVPLLNNGGCRITQ